jgi:hypothetical protein
MVAFQAASADQIVQQTGTCDFADQARAIHQIICVQFGAVSAFAVYPDQGFVGAVVAWRVARVEP